MQNIKPYIIYTLVICLISTVPVLKFPINSLIPFVQSFSSWLFTRQFSFLNLQHSNHREIMETVWLNCTPLEKNKHLKYCYISITINYLWAKAIHTEWVGKLFFIFLDQSGECTFNSDVNVDSANSAAISAENFLSHFAISLPGTAHKL